MTLPRSFAVATLLCACNATSTQTIVEIRADRVIEQDADELRVEVRNDSNDVTYARSIAVRSAEFPGFPVEIPVTASFGSTRFEMRVEARRIVRSGDETVITVLAENRVRLGFGQASASRFTLWLLSGCRCNVELERCEPDADGDLVPECVPIDVPEILLDATVADAAVADAQTEDAEAHGARPGDAGLPPDGNASMACSADQHLCDGRCVPRASPLFCGPSCVACPQSAGSTARCEADQCVMACDASTHTRCAGQCVDTQADVSHCGACSNRCAGEMTCRQGQCVAPLGCDPNSASSCSGFTYCHPTRRVCLAGCARDAQCPNGRVCDTSTHTCRCALGQRVCGSTCTTCPTGMGISSAGCEGNACVVTACGPGYTREPTRCVDIDECSDAARCSGNAVCVNSVGSFQCSCEAPNQMCGQDCVLCPSGPGVLTTSCAGNLCVVASCATGFELNSASGTCEEIVRTFRWRLASEAGATSRRSHAIAYDAASQEVVLFGGVNNSVTLSDLWRWDGNTWSRVPSQTALPTRRSGHAMAFHDENGRMLLFGGTIGTSTLSDTWERGLGNNWFERQPSNSPYPRARHAMAYDSSRRVVVLFGGASGAAFSDETWLWDGDRWQERSTPQSPVQRDRHALAYDAARQTVVLFGGRSNNPAGNGSISLNDTWEFNGTTWVQRSPATVPRARSGHSMAYDEVRQRVVLFGGVLSNEILDETWEWDGNNWSQRTLTPHPTTQFGQSMVYDRFRQQVVLMQGASEATGNPNATWVLGVQ